MNDQIGQLSATEAEAQLTPWAQRAAPIARQDYEARIEHARSLLHDSGADALLVTAGASLRYFCGVPWGASERLVALLITRDGEPIAICPAFEGATLAHVLTVAAVPRLWEEHENPYTLVAAAMAERGAHSLALDPAAPYFVFEGLRRALDGRAIVDASAIVDGCRARKSPAELALMQQACDMTLHVHRLAAGLMREGVTTTEIKYFIDRAHRRLGADNGSTFCIVQFGEATSHPHGVPGEQRLRENELVLIDTGCSVHGYNSDITRTYIYGKPSADAARIWELERAAQQAAFAAVRPGISGEAVDAAARTVLERGGLGPDYRLPGLPHRTGHGCGLAVHEAPYLVRGNAVALAPGNCCSNEPMIVVPEKFGVRLEDHFHVTDDGAAWFTPPSPAIDRPFA
ncbi:MAG: aminopeptidase P family protein [Rudaea sp.]|uniref:M24 family metallopeptidase n=1 Tax=unclassified Rudaea TaxID=2627037 RepID=UPI0010F50FD5|nr:MULTISPECIES: Xaa-Pro peptidase family protein [unclassified Rudaea]MBN8887816.1 aminopeptidase P family protein [Rudaea sp.]MBR0344943.1 aminopeptidase P family protein [Rudaea sp.]